MKLWHSDLITHAHSIYGQKEMSRYVRSFLAQNCCLFPKILSWYHQTVPWKPNKILDSWERGAAKKGKEQILAEGHLSEPHKIANIEPHFAYRDGNFIRFSPILNARSDTLYTSSHLILIVTLLRSGVSPFYIQCN